MHIEIIGVYPVEADEPCHLIEIMINRSEGDEVDLGQFTQEITSHGVTGKRRTTNII